MNAPRSCPKSSLSSNVGVRAAQLITLYGFSARRLWLCIALAINSLPTPQIFDYKSTVKTELGCKAVDTDTLGYIAQTLEAVYPDVIQEVDKSYDDDVDDYKTIDYKKFERDTTYALINAVKELKTKNDALEARIAALEG